jgi:ubiquinone/menaquinone biosynthesis C-methylase UbiE
MSDAPFYKDHWVNIEQERLDHYSTMFEWSPASRLLYEPANIRTGHVVAEFGCGPGHTAVEIAKWVGPKGHVHALDINSAFVEQVKGNAKKAGLEGRMTAHRSDGLDLSLATGSVDRVTTRNTLIYVDDPLATLGEFKRVLRPEGRFHIIEGDWPMMVVEPIPAPTWQSLVSAAARACRTPDIGRKLTGYLARTGFHDIDVQVITRPDITGRLLPMIKNMAKYAMGSEDFKSTDADESLAALERALEEKTYLVLAPQFVVTAVK